MGNIDDSKAQPESADDKKGKVIEQANTTPPDDLSVEIDNAFDSLFNEDKEEVIERTDASPVPPPSPDDNIEAVDADNEETIIELVDAVAPDALGPPDTGNDEDIIELTETVDDPISQLEADDDDIIELVDIVPVGEPMAQENKAKGNLIDADADDIIELTSVVDETSLSPTDGNDDDEEPVIELVDVVAPEELGAPDNTDDEDVIELTETVDDPQNQLGVDVDDIIELVDTVLSDASAAKNDDDSGDMVLGEAPEETLSLSDELDPNDTASIDLDADPDWYAQADEVETPPAEPVPDAQTQTEPPPDDEIQENPVAEQEPEQIIQLADVLNGGHLVDEDVSEEIYLGLDDTLAAEEASTEVDDTAGVIGIELDEIQADAVETDDVPALSQKQIEDAIERIVQRKYGATIEDLIAKAVERSVSREIESIKHSIMDNDEE